LRFFAALREKIFNYTEELLEWVPGVLGEKEVRAKPQRNAKISTPRGDAVKPEACLELTRTSAKCII
jgi:hypothetical protein